jgi:putative FmdB family regulatory protein
MPTYEYVCEKCGHQFEQFQPISAKPLETCPENACAQKRWGKGKVKRAISGGAGLLFKGSGFYITDYRSEKYKEAAKKDSAPAASPSDSKSSKTDSKPAATKSETKPAKSPAARP